MPTKLWSICSPRVSRSVMALSKSSIGIGVEKILQDLAVAFGEGRHDHLISLAGAADEGIGVKARV